MLPLLGMLGGEGGGQVLAAQRYSKALVGVSPSGAALAGVNAESGIISFAKKGTEILSGSPFTYSNDNGRSFVGQTVDIPSQGANYTKVATNNVIWAAIKGDSTSGGSVYRSTNRANWTGATLASNAITYWIAYGSGRWAITGSDSTTGRGALWYSTDLISFTKTVGGLSYGFPAGHLAYGHATFMAEDGGTGYIARAAASSLTSWSRVALPAAAGSAKMAYSEVHRRWVHIGVSGGLFVAAYSNNDGVAWSAGTVPSPTLTMRTIESVVALPNGGFIAVGRTAGELGAAICSATGEEWVNIPDAGDFWALCGLVVL